MAIDEEVRRADESSWTPPKDAETFLDYTVGMEPFGSFRKHDGSPPRAREVLEVEPDGTSD